MRDNLPSSTDQEGLAPAHVRVLHGSCMARTRQGVSEAQKVFFPYKQTSGPLTPR